MVSLRGVSETFAPSPGHQEPVLVLAGRQLVQVAWIVTNTLTIRLSGVEAFKKAEGWRDIHIVYE